MYRGRGGRRGVLGGGLGWCEREEWGSWLAAPPFCIDPPRCRIWIGPPCHVKGAYTAGDMVEQWRLEGISHDLGESGIELVRETAPATSFAQVSHIHTHFPHMSQPILPIFQNLIRFFCRSSPPQRLHTAGGARHRFSPTLRRPYPLSVRSAPETPLTPP